MKRFIERIINSEFLTFNEVLRLKVSIVSMFLLVFVVLAIALSSFNTLPDNIIIGFSIGFVLMVLLTIIFTIVNQNRIAMHSSIIIIVFITWYYTSGSNHFYGYMLFFVALTVIIFYQDILTYLFYGGIVTLYGFWYIMMHGSDIVGVNSTSIPISSLTYQIILIAFYLVFLIQFLISDSIYEKLNNEYVRMTKMMDKYQSFTLAHLNDKIEKEEITPEYRQSKFQQTISEISTFVNEFLEEEGQNIAEVVEYYFFLHDQDIERVIEDNNISIVARKYAMELQKYVLNNRSELISILFDFSTMFQQTKPYDETRYEYNLDKLFSNKIDKLLSLAILYKYLKTEITQYDKWGKASLKLTHEQITEMFVSKEFREFISFEQVNFFLDNQELFDEYL